jgi:hypothetical protein
MLDTGELAPLADGAAMARAEGTSVLAAVVCEPPPQPLWRARLLDNFLEVMKFAWVLQVSPLLADLGAAWRP